MNLVQRRLRSCCEKVAYFTHIRARIAAKRLGGTALYVPAPYRCIFCGQWHVGNSTRGKAV